MGDHGGHLQGQAPALARTWYSGLSLTRQFMLVGSVVVVLGIVVIATWVSTRIEDGVRQGAATATAVYMDSFVSPHLQSLAHRTTLPAAGVAALDGLLEREVIRSRVWAVNVWLPDGTIVYADRADRADHKALVGRTFAPNDTLRRAFGGAVTSSFDTPDAWEHGEAALAGMPLLEIYVPVWSESGSQVIAVAEFYEKAEDLYRDLARARRDSWLLTTVVALLVAAALYGIVARGSRTITAQRATLTEKVAEISEALRSNEELRGRVERSARRAAESNERFLRRLGADLRDGPAQLVGLALLRLDAWKPPLGSDESADRAAVHTALSAALDDVRGICGGLLLPEIDGLSLPEAVAFTVRDHERRTGARVDAWATDLPDAAPPSVKLCLCRFLQECLDYAFRHGAGSRVSARYCAGVLTAEVSAAGPGVGRPSPAGASRPLSLSGLRERIESLGGTFEVVGRVGEETRLVAQLPL